jgi:hypothetical protein
MTTVLGALAWYYLALRHTVHWLLGSPGRGQFWNELITFIICPALPIMLRNSHSREAMPRAMLQVQEALLPGLRPLYTDTK